MRHGSADSLIAAVLLNITDPALALRHDLHSLHIEVPMDHLHAYTHMVSVKKHIISVPGKGNCILVPIEPINQTQTSYSILVALENNLLIFGLTLQ